MTLRLRLTAVSALSGLALACASAGTAAAQEGAAGSAPARACASLVGLQLPASDMTISKAVAVPAAGGTPAYCRADGVIGAHKGADGKNYGLGFAIALPDSWNGRFLMQGGGGLNGALRPPLGNVASGDRSALARGFAVISTDGGHVSAAGFDTSFMGDQQASLDFAFNAVPTVASVGKQLVAQYYGRPIARSYFAGCSTGGREGMEAAERYPFMFDGILTGAPAMMTGNSNLALKWAAVAFNRVAPKDASGKLGPAFSPTDRKRVIDGILKACDELDGAKDGMVFATRACHFDPASLACKGKKTDSCLAPAQAQAIKTAFSGPVTKSGRAVYSSYPYDTGNAVEQGLPGFLLNGVGGPVGPRTPPMSIDVEADEAVVHADASQQLVDTWNWTNLSSFYGHGGKQLFFHGVSDPWFSANATAAYYERLGKDNGGADKVAQSSRLFLVPGMGHCGGGPATLDRFDMLTPLVAWVEDGKAPEQVIATGQSFPGRSRPLCPYPTHAHFKGQGDPEKADSFECRP
jgi:hypothetical protein